MSWIGPLRTKPLPGGGSLQVCHEKRPDNWGNHCGAALVTIDAFLGDRAGLDRRAQVFERFTGNLGTALPDGGDFQYLTNELLVDVHLKPTSGNQPALLERRAATSTGRRSEIWPAVVRMEGCALTTRYITPAPWREPSFKCRS